MNVDQAEIDKFSALAHRWWDPEGEFRPLHEINPLRLDWIAGHAALEGASVLDVGCGGGILTEAMARRGARVKGIDLSEKALRVAELHLQESKLDVRYEKSSVEDLEGEVVSRPVFAPCLVVDIQSCLDRSAGAFDGVR